MYAGAFIIRPFKNIGSEYGRGIGRCQLSRTELSISHHIALIQGKRQVMGGNAHLLRENPSPSCVSHLSVSGINMSGQSKAEGKKQAPHKRRLT